VEQGARDHVLAALAADHAAGRAPGQRMCTACTDVLGVTGVGIMFKVGDSHHGSLGASDETSNLVEELQFTLGEGPCVDTYATVRPVAEPDLANPIAMRWPAFSVPAVAAGVRAVFAFPLQLGAIRLGAVDLQRDHPGELRDEQYNDALTVAALVTDALLDLQAAVRPGRLAPELADAETLRIEVHRAAGMVSAQLDISVADAVVRLRARAYAEERPVRDVARDIIKRRVRFE
jgi:hypothetical protein